MSLKQLVDWPSKRVLSLRPHKIYLADTTVEIAMKNRWVLSPKHYLIKRVQAFFYSAICSYACCRLPSATLPSAPDINRQTFNKKKAAASSKNLYGRLDDEDKKEEKRNRQPTTNSLPPSLSTQFRSFYGAAAAIAAVSPAFAVAVTPVVHDVEELTDPVNEVGLALRHSIQFWQCYYLPFTHSTLLVLSFSLSPFVCVSLSLLQESHDRCWFPCHSFLLAVDQYW